MDVVSDVPRRFLSLCEAQCGGSDPASVGWWSWCCSTLGSYRWACFHSYCIFHSSIFRKSILRFVQQNRSSCIFPLNIFTISKTVASLSPSVSFSYFLNHCSLWIFPTFSLVFMEVHFQRNPNTAKEKVPVLMWAVMTMPTLLLQSQLTAFPTPLPCTKRGLQGDTQGTSLHQAEPLLSLGWTLLEPIQHLLVLQFIAPLSSRGLTLSPHLAGNIGIKLDLIANTKQSSKIALWSRLLLVTKDTRTNHNGHKMSSANQNSINILSLLSSPNSAAWTSSGPLSRQCPAASSTAVKTSTLLATRWWQGQRWSQTTWKTTPRPSTCWLRWSTSSRGSLWPANNPSRHLHAGRHSTPLPHLLQGSQQWSANLLHPTHAASHRPLLLALPHLHLSVLVQTALQHLGVRNKWTEARRRRWWPLLAPTRQVAMVVMDRWGSTMDPFLQHLWRTNKTVTPPAAWQPRRRRRRRIRPKQIRPVLVYSDQTSTSTFLIDSHLIKLWYTFTSAFGSQLLV